MIKINYKHELPLWIMVIIPFLYCYYIWNELPAVIPTHFGINGEANGWMGRPAIFIMPVTCLFIYGLFLVAKLIDPKRKNYEAFGNIFYKIRLLLGTFMFVVALLVINAGLTGKLALDHRLFTCLILTLYAFGGNLILNVKPNWFIGIRTPWTLSSETVWKQTHLVGGRILFYGSLSCILLIFILPEGWAIPVQIIFIIVFVLFSVVYSYLLYKKENKGTAGDSKP